MNSSLQALVLSAFVPACLSAAAGLLLWRYLPASAAPRYTVAAAFSSAFFVGYLLLPPWAPLLPARHWQWLPYLAVVAAVLGAVAHAEGVLLGERWLLFLLLSVAAANLLVPHWASLQLPRTTLVPALAAYLLLMSLLLDHCPFHPPPSLLLGVLAVAAGCVAVLLAALVSLSYGQLGLVAAAGLSGCSLALIRQSHETTVRAALLAYSVVVGGLAFVGCIEPQQPLIGFLAVAASPLALWAAGCPPLHRLHDGRATALQIGFVLLALAITSGWMLAASMK